MFILFITNNLKKKKKKFLKIKKKRGYRDYNLK